MSNPSIIVTRPKGDEVELTQKLHELGLRVIHEPLTEIILRHDMRHAITAALLDEPDAVIVTSRHAVQALAILSELRDLFLLCVGESTAATANALGFDRVSAANGNVASLAEYITQSYDEGSRFLYVSGDHVRADMQVLLPQMKVDRVITYETQSSDALSDTLAEQLRRGQINAVTLMSQRTAGIFLMLLTKAGLREVTSSLDVICLSKAVAAPLAAHNWRGLHIAQQPTLASLVECVDNAFGTSESQHGI